MNAETWTWPRESICLRPPALDAGLIAADMVRRTCRTDFDAPGFCVVNVGNDIDSAGLRRLMVDLKREMAAIHAADNGKTLACVSSGRFDQQETTRLHLDGGPDECLLMLGYERSLIESELEIADYAKCAFDMGLSPGQFMSDYNPMFGRGAEVLTPYTNRVPCFSSTECRIVCINNSCAPWSQARPAWQGVLHAATVPEPNHSECRVINSMMFASEPAGTPDAVDVEQHHESM